MNICMVVCNNLTRDNRVLREAQTLQAAGHEVSVVGIVAGDADVPVETMQDGVKLFRVDWRALASRRLLIRKIPWATLILILCVAAVWGTVALAENMAKFAHELRQENLQLAFACVLLGLALVTAAIAVRYRAVARAPGRERNADSFSGRNLSESKAFPAPRSWIPQWVPPELVDALAVPLAFLGRRFAQFALSQDRARQMARLCVELDPDVVHAHDCTALPVAALVKKALGIPVVYDAHEIYAEAAVRRRAVVDYYILLHRRYLPIVDRFITVNQSIADYYRHIHPDLSPAVVIRNAATRMPKSVYDGRLHEAAGLPRSEKILLYQGGFTARRGLQELVRSAGRLPEGWTLVMMGWGPLENELREIALTEPSGPQAQECAAAPRDPTKVRFIRGAPRAEVLLWTAGASLGIIPYEGDVLNHWFCTPNKLWEFPGAGVPLIVQPFPELRKVVETYRCGWILPQICTSNTLAEMIRGLTDEQFREAREGCRRFIEDDSWESAYVRPLTELYDSLNPDAQPIFGPITANTQQNTPESGLAR